MGGFFQVSIFLGGGEDSPHLPAVGNILDVANKIFQTDKAILLPNKTLKHTNPKHPLEPFVHHSFSENENLCILNCLKFYRGENNKRMDGKSG